MNKTSQDNQSLIPILSSVSDLAAGTDAWLVDVWGVIHNGLRPYEAACAACETFRGRGGSVILVSNAPRPWSGVKTQLDGLGVSPEVYDAIVTSGDVTRGLISANSGRPIYHLGPQRDVPIFDGLDVDFSSAGEAEVVALTGLFDDEHETPADYAKLLQAFKARDVPMICANPDLQVEKGERVIYCAGALAEAYAALGGSVVLAGKPYPPIYDMAFEKIAALRGALPDKSRILCIGDGINTDIKGAATMGLRSLFIPSRVNMSSSAGVRDAEIASAFADKDFRPLAAQIGLRW